MRIGIFAGNVLDSGGLIDDVVEAAQAAEKDGFASFWLPQIFGFDALTALTVAGRETKSIEVGTAVIPTYPRHPLMLAAQALTTNAAIGGRLALGIGLSHQLVIEGMFGYSFDKPLRHMTEYLSILAPLIHGEAADFEGEVLTGKGVLSIPGGDACPILVAALGPKMLELAGTVADGTLTWMTGPATITEHTGPTIRNAAKAADRPDPRIIAALPVLVTDDVDAGRERASKAFAIYGQLPSYRAMLDREGAEGPADVAIIGNEKAVTAGIKRMADAGATEFVAAEFAATETDQTRTRELLRSLL